MKTKILLLIAVIVLGFACKKSDLPTFADDSTFLNFDKKTFGSATLIDSLFSSTVFSPKENGVRADIDLEFEVILSGKTVPYDRDYKVRIISSESRDLLEGVHYTMDTIQTLKANAMRDTVVVTLKCTQIEADGLSKARLYLKLIPNENFKAGVPLYQYYVVNVYGGTLPETNIPYIYYYNQNALGKYIGYRMEGYLQKYSPIRLQVFVEVNKITSPYWTTLNNVILYEMGKKGAQWLEENPTFEADGTTRVLFNGTIKYK